MYRKSALAKACQVTRSNHLFKLQTVPYALLCLLIGSPGMAQEAASDSDNMLEEVIVTGTRIKSAEPYTSTVPISVMDKTEMAASGEVGLGELIASLPYSSGSENRVSTISQSFTTGTSNINLRTLGLGATLVLLNGRRMPLTPVWALDGSQFVDLSNLPMNLVERMEILKDGASALYGSDAIAGVANIITRDVEGLELSARYQVTTDEGNQEDSTLSLAWGWGNDDTQVNLFASYLSRTPMASGEREFTHGSQFAANGKPGSFLVLPQAGPPALMADPDCGNEASSIDLPTSAPPFAPCISNVVNSNTKFFEVVPTEERKSIFVDANHKLNDSFEVFIEYLYADNEAVRTQQSSLPNLTVAPFVPASHPNNPFGENLIMLPTARSFADGELDVDPVADFFYKTHRIAFGGNYEFSNEWSLQGSFEWGISESLDRNFSPQSNERVQLALFGLGGPDCDPASGIPGVGSCQYLNPFGSSIVSPSAPNYSPNTLQMYQWLNSPAIKEGESENTTIEFVLSGSLMDMKHGPLGVALGVQYREDTLEVRRDEATKSGDSSFFPASNDFDSEQDSYAAFVELAVPLAETLDLSLALRYEDYGGAIGDTIDPKVGLGWQVSDKVLLRGSWGTSFRGPTPIHVSSSDADVEAASGSCGGGPAAILVNTIGNTELSTEASTTFTLGGAFSPTDDLDVSVDYWNYEYEDIIGLPALQGVINDACAINPTDPASADHRLIGGAPGSIVGALFQYDNQGTIETDGVDLQIRYVIDSSAGQFKITNLSTWINTYDISSNGMTIDGVGKRNVTNFGRSTPEWRNNTILGWLRDNHNANITVRYVTDYKDDTDNSTIDDITMVDLQYGYRFDYQNGVDLSVGVLNVLDKEPPKAGGVLAFDPKVHDPRGRMAYLSLTAKF